MHTVPYPISKKGSGRVREMNSMFAARMERLAEELRRREADALFVFSSELDNRPAVQYLSGFTGSFAVVVAGVNGGRLVTDSRYFIQAEEESFLPLVRMEDRDPWPAVQEALRQLGARRLAVEDDKLSLERGRALENLLPSLIGTTRLVQQLRAVKDAEELELLRRSARIAAEAFEAFLPAIRPGRTEAELAADLVHEIRRRGAQQMAKGHFVVASGPRGARPHGIFSDRVVQPGDFITMDFGAVYNGYVSDMTRTVGVGDVAPKLVEIYHIVREAHDRAIAVVSPDATGRDVDEAARSLIRGRGYGEFFSHSTGHGIGLELHELPVVNRMNGEKLPVGSVVTVEPGIYIDGLGGVRIEDDVIVTPHGAEVITSASGTELRLLSPA